MPDEEKRQEELFRPLKTLNVQVDEATKRRLLDNIKAREANLSFADRFAAWFGPGFRPQLAVAMVAVLALGAVVWSQTAGKGSDIPGTRTIRIGDSSSGRSGGANTMMASAESDDMKYAADAAMTSLIAPAPGYENIEAKNNYRFTGQSSALETRAPDELYRITYRELDEAAVARIAGAWGFSDADRKEECPEYEIYMTDDMGREGDAVTTSDCTPIVTYENAAGRMTVSTYDAVTYVDYSTYVYREGAEDPYRQAQEGYADLPDSIPALSGDIIKNRLIETGVLPAELANALTVSGPAQTQYLCPIDESPLYAGEYKPDIEPVPDQCAKFEVFESEDTEAMARAAELTAVTVSNDGEGSSGSSSGVAIDAILPAPTPDGQEITGNRPKPYQAVYQVEAEVAASYDSGHSLIQVTVDHTGAIIGVSGRVPERIETLPTESAAAGKVIDALNRGEMETRNPMARLAMTMMPAAETETQTGEKIVLTHDFAVERIGQELLVLMGTEGDEYLVPAYRLSGTIRYDEIPAVKTARADADNKARCEAIQSELNSGEGSDMRIMDLPDAKPLDDPAVSPMVSTVDAPASSPVAEPEPGVSEPGALPAGPAEEIIPESGMDLLYQELSDRYCYVYDVDPNERHEYSESVIAFPGLNIEGGN